MSLIFHFKYRLRRRFLRFNSSLTAFLFFISASLVVTPQEVFAAPAVEAPVALPSSIQPGSPVDLLVTVRVQRTQADPIVVPGSAYLMRVTQSGTMIGNFGAMRDDGLEGDAVAGDDILSLRIHLDEAPQDGLRLRCSVAFERVVRRVTSPITVVPVVDENLAPFFTSEPLQEAEQEHFYYYQAEAEDPEGGEVTLELMQAPGDMSMSSTGLLTWTPLELQVGPQPVEIKATDSQGKTAIQSFTVNVAPYNHAPVFTTQPQRQVDAGVEYIYDADVYDRENSPIVFSLDKGPEGMSIDPVTGEVKWTPDAGEHQTVEVIIRATDADDAFATQPFKIFVVTDPLDLITPSGEFEIKVGETLELNLQANYADAGFRVTPLPENATLPFLSKTFKFTPTAEQVGVFNLGFEAVFAKMRDINSVLIRVVKENAPPILDPLAAQTVSEGQELRIPVSASDADGDKLSFYLPGLAVDNLYFDEIKQELVFIPDFDQAGNYSVLVRVSDKTDIDEKTVDIEVLNVEETNFQSLDLVIDNLQNPNFRPTIPISGSVSGEIRTQPYAPPVFISGLAPNFVQQGREQTVDITGFNTSFDAADTTFDFGAGITIVSTTFTSATEAAVLVKADIAAETGPRQVIVREGSEEILSAVAFDVLQSASRIDGVLIDAFTQQPVVGARVGVNGTFLVDHTDNDGHFSIDGLTVGKHNLVITAQNYEVVNFELALDDNVPLDLGEIEVNALARPFQPGGSIPRGATVASVLDRGIATQDMDLSLEQAKALIIDALIALPGNEFGVYDEAGNQLNPGTSGSGGFSLTPQGVSQHASALLQGDVHTLEDILDALHGSFAWIFGENFTKRALLSALQSAVRRAWANPGDPYNALPIMVFNDGRTLSTTPPEIGFATPLNNFQAYLLIMSFMIRYAPTLDHAFGQLYELNGLEAPTIELDPVTLERVVTIHGEEIRSGAPSFAQGDFGQPVQLAAAGISDYLLGSSVYAENAPPNDDGRQPSVTERMFPNGITGEIVNFAAAFAFSLAFVVLGVIFLGWLGLGAGLAAASVGGLMLTALVGAGIGYAGSIFARGAGAYFGPQAVQSLTPPPPGAIRHRQSEDVRKVYIQFQKDFRHTERDNTVGDDGPLFPRFATLVDLFGPEVNLDLVDFEYQLWRVKDIHTQMINRDEVELISTHATAVPAGDVAGGSQRSDFLQFTLPVERLNQGENIFKIRTVMFYRGHLMFEQDVERRSGITLEELGIRGAVPLVDPGYKEIISLNTTQLSVAESEINALDQTVRDKINAFDNRLIELEAEVEGANKSLHNLKGRQKIWQNYLDQETKRLADIQATELTDLERIRLQRYRATGDLLLGHVVKGGNINDLFNPNTEVGRQMLDAAGGQGELDNIKAEVEKIAKARNDYRKVQNRIDTREPKVKHIKAEQTKFQDAYLKARNSGVTQEVQVKYTTTELPGPGNPDPLPQTVDVTYKVQSNGRVILPSGDDQAYETVKRTIERDVFAEERRLERERLELSDKRNQINNASQELQDKFIAQDRVDEMNRKIETQKDKMKKLAENRDQHKAQIQRNKEVLELDAAERAATRGELRPLSETKLKIKQSNIQKLANTRAVRALNSNTGQGVLTAATAIADSAWEIREGIKMLPSAFSAPYIVTRNGDQITQFGPSSPPVPPALGPGGSGSGNPGSGGPMPRTRLTLREAFQNLNLFSVPLAFAQSPLPVFAPYFESDPDSDNLLGFLRTLADPDNPKGGFLARQFPFTQPNSFVTSAGFFSDFIAVDSKGAVYLLNGNSYDNFGGRIFRFTGEPAFREHIGQMNYYSSLLGFTRKVRPIAMEVGEFNDSTYDVVENLFIANREEGIPLLSGGSPPPNRILRVPVHLADLHPGFANGQNRNRIVGQPYVSHPDFKFTGPSDMERDSRPRENDSAPPRPFYFSDEENIFVIEQIDGQEAGEARKIVSVPGRRWSGLAQDVNGNFFFADYNRGEVFLLAAEELDNIVNGSYGIIASESELDFRTYLIKVGIDRPGDIELDTQQERYVVSTPNGFEAFDLVLVGRYTPGIQSIVSDVLGQQAPVTLRPTRGNVFIVGKPTEGDNVRRVRLKIKRRNSETGAAYWSEEAMHLEEFGATIYDGTLS